MSEEIQQPQETTPAQSQPEIFSHIGREKAAAEDFHESLQNVVDYDPDSEEFELVEKPTEEPEAAEPEEESPEQHREQLLAIAKELGFDESDLENPKIAALLERGLAEMAARSENTEAPDAEEQYTQYVEGLRQFVKDPSVSDPRRVADFRGALSEVFGADSPEAAANVERLSDVLMEHGTGLISSVVPALVAQQLPALLESILPGVTAKYYESVIGDTWDSTLDSDPNFASLPRFGTNEFSVAAEQVYAANPWLESFDPKDAHGNPLPLQDALRTKATVVAQLLTGVQVTPETLAQAVQTGKKQAVAAQSRVAASRVMGAGKSKGEFQPSENDDPIAKSFAAYQQHYGGAFTKR
jgi:hypothetical protein